MRICITGTPGTGKTSIARALGRALGYKALNEKEFAIQQGIVVGGEFDSAENELVVPLEKLEARLNKMLAGEKNIIVEGHMLCEISGRFDLVVLLRLNPERLTARLKLRGYPEVKIQDNVFCEGIDYCKKHALRNYPKAILLEVENKQTIKETSALLISEILARQKRGRKKALKTSRPKKKVIQ